MSLIHLGITGLRNLVSIEVKPIAKGFNFIYGENGSGKTSLLEAIYYLSLGRSFRSSVIQRIIHHNSEKMSIFANISTLDEQHFPIGLERHATGDLILRANGRDIKSIAEHANLLPMQLIDSLSLFIKWRSVFVGNILIGDFYLTRIFDWRQYGAPLRGALPCADKYHAAGWLCGLMSSLSCVAI